MSCKAFNVGLQCPRELWSHSLAGTWAAQWLCRAHTLQASTRWVRYKWEIDDQQEKGKQIYLVLIPLLTAPRPKKKKKKGELAENVWLEKLQYPLNVEANYNDSSPPWPFLTWGDLWADANGRRLSPLSPPSMWSFAEKRVASSWIENSMPVRGFSSKQPLPRQFIPIRFQWHDLRHKTIQTKWLRGRRQRLSTLKP